MTLACGIHGDVGKVARVRPAGVLGAVLGILRVEVGTRRGEGRRFTSPHLVDVDALDARLDALEIEQDPDSVIFLQKHGASHHAAAGIPERRAGDGRTLRHAGDIGQAARAQRERQREDPHPGVRS